MVAQNLAQGTHMHAYNTPREHVGTQTVCETCNTTMRTCDWPAHKRGKKHDKALKKNAKDAADALAAERIATSWGDEANEAAANDSAAANDHGRPSSDRACRNCGQEGHFSRDCTEPRSGGGGGGGACHNCGQEGHFARDCPEPRSGGGGGRACRNCGSTDHLARECPERSAPTCHKCKQPGHISKDCSVIKCDNCDADDHEWKQCPLKKNWEKIMADWKCKNCEKKGHSAKKCPNPTVGGSGFGGDSGNGGFGNAASYGNAGGFENGGSNNGGFNSGGFDNAAVADGATASSSWDTTPAADNGNQWA